jgi:drug/metabolite transporter (DMT)-like permease
MPLASTSRAAWSQLAPQSWLALLHLTVGAGIIGWTCWYWALARGGIARVSVLQFFRPVLALMMAGAISSERATPPLLAAAATIPLDVAIARRSGELAAPVAIVETAASEALTRAPANG